MTRQTADTETDAGWLELDSADGPMRVYRAAPPGAPRQAAAVIVLHEAFGVNDHIQDVTRRVAAEGYLALAPDLFHRTDPAILDYADHPAAMERIAALGPDQIAGDVAAVLAHLGAVENVPVQRTSVIGFCFGGRAAVTVATQTPGLAGTIAFYGPGIAAGPHAVLDAVAGITGPVLMLVGDQDPTIPAEHVAAIREACGQAGVDLRLRIFPGAGHAFHCDARPALYRADAARQAWREAAAFLRETAGSPPASPAAGQALASVTLIDPEDLPPELAKRLRARIDRLGYLGDFFRIAAHQPAMLAAFIDFTEAGRQALPGALAEIVALTVATYTRNDYERHQHERLAVRMGLGRDWVQAVERLDPDHEDLSPEQQATMTWIIAALKDQGHDSGQSLERLVEKLGPATAIAVVLLTGRYLAHATLVNSFGVRPPVTSIFADGSGRGPQHQPPRDAVPNHEMLYFVSTNLVGDDPSALGSVLREHTAFLKRLNNEGRLMFCGPLETADGSNTGDGIYAIRAASLEEAESVVAQDPMHKAKIRAATVRPWHLRSGWSDVVLNDGP
jgi:carboxymethylenebutenolidase